MFTAFGLVKTSPQKITDAIFIEIDNKLKIKKKNVSAMFNYLKKKKNNSNFSKNNFNSLIQNIGINNLNKINITTIYDYINKPLFSDIKELKNIIKNTITNNSKRSIYLNNNTNQNTKKVNNLLQSPSTISVSNAEYDEFFNTHSPIKSPNIGSTIQKNNLNKKKKLLAELIKIKKVNKTTQNRTQPTPTGLSLQSNSSIISQINNRIQTQQQTPPSQNRPQPPPPPPRNRPPPPTIPKKNNNLNTNVSNHSHLNQKNLLAGLMKLKKVKNNTQKNNGNKSGNILNSNQLNLNKLKPNQLIGIKQGLRQTSGIIKKPNNKPPTELQRRLAAQRERSEA